MMKKSEKIISAALTVALGLPLMILQGRIISIVMTVLGVGLLVLGVMDLFHKLVPPAIIKLVAGVVIIVCGWAIVGAVLYIVAAALLIVGILALYEKLKNRVCFKSVLQTIASYAVPGLCIVIGLLLLFNQGNTVNWVFIVSGGFTVIEGCLLLINASLED